MNCRGGSRLWCWGSITLLSSHATSGGLVDQRSALQILHLIRLTEHWCSRSLCTCVVNSRERRCKLYIQCNEPGPTMLHRTYFLWTALQRPFVHLFDYAIVHLCISSIVNCAFVHLFDCATVQFCNCLARKPVFSVQYFFKKWHIIITIREREVW